MASIVGSATTSGYGATTLTLNTSGIAMVADDTLLIFVGTQGGNTPSITSTTPSGYGTGSDLGTNSSASGGVRTVTGRFFDIDETGAITQVVVNLGHSPAVNAGACAMAVCVRGIDSADIGLDYSTGTASSPNPPAQISPDSDLDALFFALMVGCTADSSPGAPSGYTEAVTVFNAGGPLGMTMSVASLVVAGPDAASNPGTFSSMASSTWTAGTMGMPIIPEAGQDVSPTAVKPSDDSVAFVHTIALSQALVPTAKITDTDGVAFVHSIARQGFVQPAAVFAPGDTLITPVVALKDRFLLADTLFDQDNFFTQLIQRDSGAIVSAEVPVARGVARSIFLIDVDAVDELGASLTLRYGTDGVMTVAEGVEAAEHYEPRIIDPGNFEHHLFEPSQTFGPTSAGFGDVEIAAAGAGRGGATTDALLDYAVDGRQISIYEIASRRTPKSQWELRLRGIVDFLSSDDAYNKLAFKITDSLKALEQPLLTEAYAGTTTGGEQGTVEGNVSLTGAKKQKCYGSVTNVEGQPVNPFDLIWLFSNGAVESLTVYDAGAELILNDNFASLEDLFNWEQEPGEYATCLSLGLARLGSSPVGTVTADVVTGADAEDRTAGQLVRSILQERYEFNTGTTTVELLTQSPDTLTPTGATITGFGPFRIVESANESEHLARTAAITKEPRSVSYTLVGEFLIDADRGVAFRLANSAEEFAAVMWDWEGEEVQTVEHGGYALTSYDITQLSDDYFRITMTVTSNSATTLYAEIALFTITDRQAG